jgi:hypothetical protein
MQERIRLTLKILIRPVIWRFQANFIKGLLPSATIKEGRYDLVVAK